MNGQQYVWRYTYPDGKTPLDFEANVAVTKEVVRHSLLPIEAGLFDGARAAKERSGASNISRSLRGRSWWR